MSDYVGEEIPRFAFVNKTVLHNYLTYQQENLEIQEQLISEQIDELKQQIQSKPKKTVKFVLPEEL